VSAPARRGWCPGLSSPMPTGDGLLVRLLPADHISAECFIALCEAGRRHGNGTIEISARGSVQIRGLTERSAAAFARDVEALAIPAVDGVPIFADPLPEDPDALIDATKLARELRASIAQAHLPLGAKVCVAIDGGGRLHLDALGADLRLRAIATESGLRLHVAVAGDARAAVPLGSILPKRASETVLRLLAVIARHGPTARARDCVSELGKTPIESCAEPCRLVVRPPAQPIGVHPLRGGRCALGLAPAFGHMHANALSELARIASVHGATALRPTLGRALLLIGLARDAADQVAAQAHALGFITRPDDARRRIIACPGSPACASGLIPARTLAAEIAPHVQNVEGTIHISGCTKGCAHPAPAVLSIVGTEQGCGIVRNGTTRVTPSRYVDAADLIAEVMTHG
jgi:precorrin-3B synthase